MSDNLPKVVWLRVLVTCAAAAALCPAAAPAPAWAQSSAYRLDRWTADNGLPSNTVTDLLQTRDGYLWLATAGGLVRFDGTQFELVGGPESGLPSIRIAGLAEGRGDTIWIVTDNGHLAWRAGGRFGVLAAAGDALIDVVQDSAGTLWVSRSAGLLRYDGGRLVIVAEDLDLLYATRDFTPHKPQLWIDSGHRMWLRDDRAGRLFTVQRGELVRGPTAPYPVILTVPSTGAVLLSRRAPPYLEVLDASGAVRWRARPGPGAVPRLVDRDGRLWVTTEQGVEVFDTAGTEAVARLALPDRVQIGRMMEDREGNVWAGTGSYGLLRMMAVPFRNYGVDDGIRESQVLMATRGRDGTVLAVDRRWNLYRIGSTGVELLFEARHGGDLSDHVWGAYEDRRGTVWLGRGTGAGPDVFVEGRPAGGPPVRLDLPGVTVPRQFLEDPDDAGALWFSDRRIYRARPYAAQPAVTDTFLAEHHRNIRFMLRDRHGSIWAAGNEGIVRIRPDGSVRSYGMADGLPTDNVRTLLEDRHGVLWAGTYGGGVARYEGDRFRAVRRADGLAEDVVSTILEDDAGNFWMGGNAGVQRVSRDALVAFLDGRRASVASVAYGRNAGILNPEGSGWHGYRSPDGRLWFPTFEGLAVVDPARAIALERDAPLVHVEAVRAGTAVHPAAAGIRLGAADRRFDVVYTGISLRDPAGIRFQYRLEGLDPDWIEAGTARVATYTNVPAGSYTFRLRALSGAGVASTTEAALPLSVAPFYYETTWFYLLVGLLALSLLWLGDRYRLVRVRARELELADLVRRRTDALASEKGRAEAALATVATQAEALRSLDQAKSRFFANVSHEFRTPLTLVLGPLDDVDQGRAGALPDAAGDRVRLALRSARRLGTLVDQLFDLARLEAGRLEPRLVPGDAGTLLRDVGCAFAPLADRTGTRLVMDLPHTTLPVLFDADQFDKVLTNLLGNAFKFTPAGGAIMFTARVEGVDGAGPGTLVIEVSDTGPGIPETELERVFERFHQVPSAGGASAGGIGVGLALVRDLVHRHGGSIDARNVEGGGACFRVILPLAGAPGPLAADDGALPADAGVMQADDGPLPAAGRAHARPGAARVRDTATVRTVHEDVPTVLIVDDEPDLRGWIRDHFTADYRVVEAADGNTALDRIREVVPDVVISDVMMPGLDGEALCAAVRADAEIAFVPIILLTARASHGDVVHGLEGGADDYLTKPFDIRELRARVHNIIAARGRLRDRLRAGYPQPPRPSVPDAAAEALLDRVYRALAEQIADEDLDVDRLARALAMSRATLYRRLEAVLDCSPKELIWRYRLQQAAAWLAGTDASVAEVAYGVGFKSVPHFSSRFRAHFGCSPTAYRARAHDVAAAETPATTI